MSSSIDAGLHVQSWLWSRKADGPYYLQANAQIQLNSVVVREVSSLSVCSGAKHSTMPALVSICSHRVQLSSIHPTAAGPGKSAPGVTQQATLSLLPHQLWSSLIQPAATESLEGILVGIPKQKHFLLLRWIFLFWTQGCLLPSWGIWRKDRCQLYHLVDAAAGGYHLPKSPFVQFCLQSGIYIYTPDVFPQNKKILGVIMGKQHFTSCKEGWPGCSIIEEELFLTQVWHMNKFCPNARQVMPPAFLQDILHFFPLRWNAEPQQQQHEATKAKMTQQSWT